MSAPGLVLVATPIGNLGDLSPRAIEELAGADVIACEDTRRTGRLLKYAGIAAPRLVVVNDHTESRARSNLVERLGRGERVVLVSDAGTPGVSDPGERLVHAAASAGYAVTVVPGPSAAISALVASGLPTGRFVFEGFLPRKGSGRTRRLAALATEGRTMIVFEAPHRMARTLADLSVSLGSGRRVAVARELTKLHEEIFRGSLAEAVIWAEAGMKGEAVVVIEGAPEADDATDEEILSELATARANGASTRDASADVAERLGVSKRRVYTLATSSG